MLTILVLAYYRMKIVLTNKIQTFCQLKGKLTERKGEIEKGLTLKEEDFKFLKNLEKRLYTLKEREELISTLYYLSGLFGVSEENIQ